MVKERKKKKVEPTELDMTSMIDIVFMLLIFFILTFNPTKPEANFTLSLPSAGSPPESVEDLPEPLPAVRLKSSSKSGSFLKEIAMVESMKGLSPFPGDPWKITITSEPGKNPKDPATVAHEAECQAAFDQLRERMKKFKGKQKDPQITIFCQESLQYYYLIQAVSAISGEKVGTEKDFDILTIFQKIKFEPI